MVTMDKQKNVNDWTVDDLEQAFPVINWREPIEINWAVGDSKFACRICIANVGLKVDSPHQWSTAHQAQEHIKRHY